MKCQVCSKNQSECIHRFFGPSKNSSEAHINPPPPPPPTPEPQILEDSGGEADSEDYLIENKDIFKPADFFTNKQCARCKTKIHALKKRLKFLEDIVFKNKNFY